MLSPVPSPRPPARSPAHGRGRHVSLWFLFAFALTVPLLAAATATAAPGDVVWNKTYSANSKADIFYDVVRGPGDVFYCAGVTNGTEEVSTLLLVKYKDNGGSATQVWKRTYRWPGRVGSAARSVEVDSHGQVLVAGTIGLSTGSGRDIIVLKYTPGGSLQWARRWGGAALRDDYVNDLAVDSSSNALVAGVTRGAKTGQDYVVLKVLSGGSLRWAKVYAGPKGTDQARAIAVDMRNNAYVTGVSRALSGVLAAATLKISPSGHVIWTRRLITGAGDTVANDIDVTTDAGIAGVVIAGRMDGGMSTGRDGMVAKYSTQSGTWQWTHEEDCLGDDDEIYAMTLDANGTAIAAGETTDRGTLVGHAWPLAVDTAGARSWTFNGYWLGAATNPSLFQAVAVDPSGTAYFGGFARDDAGYDLLAQSSVSSGGLWRLADGLFQTTASTDDWCRALIWATGGLYAAGQSTTAAGNVNAVLVKFEP